MDSNYPNNTDPRPKRRKDKDNPYTIYSIGAETEHPKYFVRFTDGAGIDHCQEISKELFDLMDEFELEDLSHLNEIDRHYVQENTNVNPDDFIMQAKNVEEQVIESLEFSKVHKAISALPPAQQRRITLRYFESKTYAEIGLVDNCSKQTAQESVAAAEENIRKYLKKFSE